jgi:dTMP kinase
LIYTLLEEEGEIIPSPEVLSLLYFADFLKDKEKIEKAVENGYFVIADRYFTSTLAYQSLSLPLEKLLTLAETFALPKPDIVIFLKISPETSLKRKLKEKQELDKFESNIEFLRKVSERYEELAKQHVFSKWVVVDGEKSIEEVAEEIWKIVEPMIENQS